jgi:hypothetical protein
MQEAAGCIKQQGRAHILSWDDNQTLLGCRLHDVERSRSSLLTQCSAAQPRVNGVPLVSDTSLSGRLAGSQVSSCLLLQMLSAPQAAGCTDWRGANYAGDSAQPSTSRIDKRAVHPVLLEL